MSRLLSPLTLTLLFGTTLAVAQYNSIRWGTDPRAAVAEAQRTMRPLMVYARPSSHERNDDIENDQKRAFRDPRVLRLAERFVTLRLSHSQHRDLLKEFGLPDRASLEMSFVMPDGFVLGRLSVGGVAQTDSLVQKLTLVLQAHRQRLFEKEVKPKLENAEAKPDELKLALQLVGQFRMTVADGSVAGLLDREKLTPEVRLLACDVLAALSTKAAVTKLLELSRVGDELATKALEKCTPAGAELMLVELRPAGTPTATGDVEPFDYPVYKAVTKICRIRQVKPARFFEKASARVQEQELERIRKLVTDAAQRWKAEHDEQR